METHKQINCKFGHRCFYLPKQKCPDHHPNSDFLQFDQFITETLHFYSKFRVSGFHFTGIIVFKQIPLIVPLLSLLEKSQICKYLCSEENISTENSIIIKFLSNADSFFSFKNDNQNDYQLSNPPSIYTLEILPFNQQDIYPPVKVINRLNLKYTSEINCVLDMVTNKSLLPFPTPFEEYASSSEMDDLHSQKRLLNGIFRIFPHDLRPKIQTSSNQKNINLQDNELNRAFDFEQIQFIQDYSRNRKFPMIRIVNVERSRKSEMMIGIILHIPQRNFFHEYMKYILIGQNVQEEKQIGEFSQKQLNTFKKEKIIMPQIVEEEKYINEIAQKQFNRFKKEILSDEQSNQNSINEYNKIAPKTTPLFFIPFQITLPPFFIQNVEIENLVQKDEIIYGKLFQAQLLEWPVYSRYPICKIIDRMGDLSDGRTVATTLIYSMGLNLHYSRDAQKEIDFILDDIFYSREKQQKFRTNEKQKKEKNKQNSNPKKNIYKKSSDVEYIKSLQKAEFAGQLNENISADSEKNLNIKNTEEEIQKEDKGDFFQNMKKQEIKESQFIFSIDNKNTSFIDDCLSISEDKTNETYTIGIHLADPTKFLSQKKSNFILKEAGKRVKTVYLGKYMCKHLFPVEIIKELSFNKGVQRYMWSVYFKIDIQTGRIDFNKTEIIEEKLTNYLQLDFKSAELLIQKGFQKNNFTNPSQQADVSLLSQVNEQIKEYRKSLHFEVRDYEIEDDYLQPEDKQYKKSKQLVQSWMVLTNQYISYYLKHAQKNLRKQFESTKIILANDLEQLKELARKKKILIEKTFYVEKEQLLIQLEQSIQQIKEQRQIQLEKRHRMIEAQQKKAQEQEQEKKKQGYIEQQDILGQQQEINVNEKTTQNEGDETQKFGENDDDDLLQQEKDNESDLAEENNFISNLQEEIQNQDQNQQFQREEIEIDLPQQKSLLQSLQDEENDSADDDENERVKLNVDMNQIEANDAQRSIIFAQEIWRKLGYKLDLSNEDSYKRSQKQILNSSTVPTIIQDYIKFLLIVISRNIFIFMNNEQSNQQQLRDFPKQFDKSEKGKKPGIQEKKEEELKNQNSNSNLYKKDNNEEEKIQKENKFQKLYPEEKYIANILTQQPSTQSQEGKDEETGKKTIEPKNNLSMKQDNIEEEEEEEEKHNILSNEDNLCENQISQSLNKEKASQYLQKIDPESQITLLDKQISQMKISDSSFPLLPSIQNQDNKQQQQEKQNQQNQGKKEKSLNEKNESNFVEQQSINKSNFLSSTQSNPQRNPLKEEIIIIKQNDIIIIPEIQHDTQIPQQLPNNKIKEEKQFEKLNADQDSKIAFPKTQLSEEDILKETNELAKTIFESFRWANQHEKFTFTSPLRQFQDFLCQKLLKLTVNLMNDLQNMPELISSYTSEILSDINSNEFSDIEREMSEIHDDIIKEMVAPKKQSRKQGKRGGKCFEEKDMILIQQKNIQALINQVLKKRMQDLKQLVEIHSEESSREIKYMELDIQKVKSDLKELQQYIIENKSYKDQQLDQVERQIERYELCVRIKERGGFKTEALVFAIKFDGKIRVFVPQLRQELDLVIQCIEKQVSRPFNTDDNGKIGVEFSLEDPQKYNSFIEIELREFDAIYVEIKVQNEFPYNFQARFLKK